MQCTSSTSTLSSSSSSSSAASSSDTPLPSPTSCARHFNPSTSHQQNIEREGDGENGEHLLLQNGHRRGLVEEDPLPLPQHRRHGPAAPSVERESNGKSASAKEEEELSDAQAAQRAADALGAQTARSPLLHPSASLPELARYGQYSSGLTTPLGFVPNAVSRLTPLQRAHQGSRLVTFLLEHLCSMYESNPERSQQLFKGLFRRLVRMRAIDDLPLESTTEIRQAYREAFQALLRQARQAIDEGEESESCSPTTPSSYATRFNEAQLVLPRAPQAEEQEPSISAFMRHSRYSNEFEELGYVGEGGFGSVFRARHNLDHSLYAVKKVRLRRREAYEKVLREVTTLARLDHPYIVRYHAAWLEENTQGRLRLESMENSVGDSQSKSYDASATSSDAPDCLATGDGSSSAPSTPATASLVLYIQMQLCEHSLHDWLRQRWGMDGSASYDTAARGGPTPEDGHSHGADDGDDHEEEAHLRGIFDALSIFRQMAEGVAYIHAQSLIHRDLKPHNVFLRRKVGRRGGWHVAIGDFGLARQLPSGDVMGMPTSPRGDAAAASELQHVAIMPVPSSMSTGVGTETYAPPEQLYGNSYDHKVDVYSLGLMFYELLSYFHTEMERLSHFRDLKSGIIPTEFMAKFPKESAFILFMTAANPDDRPAAADLLGGDEALFEDELPRRVRVSSLSSQESGPSGVGLSGASEGNIDGLVSTVMTQEVHAENAIVEEPPSPANGAEHGDHGANTTHLEAAALVKEYEAKMAAQLDVIFRQQETIRRQEEEINDLRRRLAATGL